MSEPSEQSLSPEVGLAAVWLLQIAADPETFRLRLMKLAQTIDTAMKVTASMKDAEKLFKTARAAHERRLAEKTAAQAVEHAASVRQLRALETDLASRERDLVAERKRIEAREQWVEQRAADLNQRYRGAA